PAAAEHGDAELVALDPLGADTLRTLAFGAVAGRLLVLLELLELGLDVGARALDLAGNLGLRLQQLLSALPDQSPIGREGAGALGRRRRHRLLLLELLIEAQHLGAKARRKRLEPGQLAPVLLQRPTMQAHELLQRIHWAPRAGAARRISASRAYPAAS